MKKRLHAPTLKRKLTPSNRDLLARLTVSHTTGLNFQELLSNPRFHFRLSGCPRLDHIQRELNAVHKFRTALFYSWMQFITSYPPCLRAIFLILFSHLRLGFKSGFSTPGFRIKYHRYFSSFSFRVSHSLSASLFCYNPNNIWWILQTIKWWPHNFLHTTLDYKNFWKL